MADSKTANVDFNVVLRDSYGEEITSPVDEEGTRRKLSLGHACIMGLAATAEGEKVSPEDKIIRGKLAKRLVKTGGKTPVYDVFNPAAEERTLLLKGIDNVYGSIVYEEANTLLQP